jgi:hypothetical protein
MKALTTIRKMLADLSIPLLFEKSFFETMSRKTAADLSRMCAENIDHAHKQGRRASDSIIQTFAVATIIVDMYAADDEAWDDISRKVAAVYAAIERRKAQTTDADEIVNLNRFYHIISDFYGPLF